MLALAAGLVVLAYFTPLWRLTMFAPQYEHGLQLDIHSYTLEGGHGGQDIKEINLLNHYIGMHPLEAEDFDEFKWMPFVLGGIALLFLRGVVLGTVKELVDATAVFGYFGAFSLWSFAYKMYRYGHDLAPEAPVKVAPFTAARLRVPAHRQLRGVLVPARRHVPVARRRRRAARRARAGVAASRDSCERFMIATLLIVMAQAIGASAGPLEPRPLPADTSPLQARVDAAPDGASVEVGPGVYRGDLTLDRPVRLIGHGRRCSRDPGRAVSFGSAGPRSRSKDSTSMAARAGGWKPTRPAFTWRPRARRFATAGFDGPCSASTSSRRTARGSSDAWSMACAGRDPGEQGIGHPRVQHDTPLR
jgi:hypothetical protein